MIKTISIIGNKKGYTLFEVLCAIVVISVGLTFIFPSFFKSADTLNYLSQRFKAGVLLNNIVVEGSDYLRENGSFDGWSPSGRTALGSVEYLYTVETAPVDRSGQTVRMTARVTWEGSRKSELSKTVFISSKI